MTHPPAESPAALHDPADPRPAQPLAPHAMLPEYYAQEEQRRAFVRAIFDRTARDYDRVERLMSS